MSPSIQKIVYFNRFKLILFSSASLGLELLLYLIFNDLPSISKTNNYNLNILYFFFILLFLFFGISFLSIFYKLIFNIPALVLDKNGIIFTPIIRNKIFIRWSDVASFEQINHYRYHVILVYLKNPKMYLTELNFFTRISTKIDLATNKAICISASNLEITHSELYYILTTFLI